MGYCTTSITRKTKKECLAQMERRRQFAEKDIGYLPDVSRLVWVREVTSRFDGIAVVVERVWKLWFHVDK